MAVPKKTAGSVDSMEFERRAINYLSTGKDEARESSWLASSIQADSSLNTVLARVASEAVSNAKALGEQEINKVWARMQLVTAKSLGVEDYIRGGAKKGGGDEPS